MAHPEQKEFVEAIRTAFPDMFRGVRVLEIGSLDINGSVRQQFIPSEYIGLDVGEGPGVDVVCEGQKYDAPDNSFDVVISAECLEHNPYWRETMLNMFRLCRPGGMLLMSCATTGRPEHGTRRTTPQDAPLISWDYYRNVTIKDLLSEIVPGKLSSTWMACENYRSQDLYFVAFKKGGEPPAGAARALENIRAMYRRRNLSSWFLIKRRMLLAIFGETRYLAGSLLPWKNRY